MCPPRRRGDPCPLLFGSRAQGTFVPYTRPRQERAVAAGCPVPVPRPSPMGAAHRVPVPRPGPVGATHRVLHGLGCTPGLGGRHSNPHAAPRPGAKQARSAPPGRCWDGSSAFSCLGFPLGSAAAPALGLLTSWGSPCALAPAPCAPPAAALAAVITQPGSFSSACSHRPVPWMSPQKPGRCVSTPVPGIAAGKARLPPSVTRDDVATAPGPESWSLHTGHSQALAPASVPAGVPTILSIAGLVPGAGCSRRPLLDPCRGQQPTASSAHYPGDTGWGGHLSPQAASTPRRLQPSRRLLGAAESGVGVGAWPGARWRQGRLGGRAG